MDMRQRDRETRRRTRHSTTSSNGRHLHHNWSDPQTGGEPYEGQTQASESLPLWREPNETTRPQQHSQTGYPIDPEFEWMGRNRSTKDDNPYHLPPHLRPRRATTPSSLQRSNVQSASEAKGATGQPHSPTPASAASTVDAQQPQPDVLPSSGSVLTAR